MIVELCVCVNGLKILVLSNRLRYCFCTGSLRYFCYYFRLLSQKSDANIVDSSLGQYWGGETAGKLTAILTKQLGHVKRRQSLERICLTRKSGRIQGRRDREQNMRKVPWDRWIC